MHINRSFSLFGHSLQLIWGLILLLSFPLLLSAQYSDSEKSEFLYKRITNNKGVNYIFPTELNRNVNSIRIDTNIVTKSDSLDDDNQGSKQPDNGDESNIFTYTPSRLLKKGQFEIQLFNNLYTQTAYRDGNRDKVELDTRDTYYSALFYALYGISKSSKVNVGFDINLKSVYIDTTKGSPLNVFRFDKTSHSRTAITSLGPKIKFQPFRNFSSFSIQSAFWIPVAEDLESIEEMSDYPWMDYNMYTWWNQFFYDKNLGSQWQLFLEADLLFRFKTKNSNIPTHVDVPLSVFVSWFPLRNTTIYYQLQYSPRFQLETSYATDDNQEQNPIAEPFDLISDYAHTGLGVKFQITPNFFIEASSTYFFTSLNGGAGTTFNLGFRFIY